MWLLEGMRANKKKKFLSHCQNSQKLHELRKPARVVWGLTSASFLFGARTMLSARDLPASTWCEALAAHLERTVAIMRFLWVGSRFWRRKELVWSFWTPSFVM